MKQLRCLGGFRNERSDYDFEGFKLELDKTHFAHGTVYELEVETVRHRASHISGRERKASQCLLHIIHWNLVLLRRGKHSYM